MYPPLNLTILDRKSHDAELLDRLRARRVPVALAALFGGFSPRWASDACERLLIAGVVWEAGDGRLHVIDHKKVAV